MHIPDGILPASACVGGYAATGVATWLSLRRISRRGDAELGIPRASVMAAVFFVASWIHIPVFPVSTHLVLNGLMGVVLGAYAFPAILVGLFFQAVMFQHGGLTTLGVNAVIMGIPALMAGCAFRILTDRWPGTRMTTVWGFFCGASSIAVSVLMLTAVLVVFFGGDIDPSTEEDVVDVLFLSHVPLMLIEGVITASMVRFLRKVHPEMLDGGR
ncbi:cobalt transporter CbiM [Candidatus Fermentibacteria bacterium]|nr:cobalt transporter CbiM [Candidatus Fermentibacteria bacterium]